MVAVFACVLATGFGPVIVSGWDPSWGISGLQDFLLCNPLVELRLT